MKKSAKTIRRLAFILFLQVMVSIYAMAQVGHWRLNNDAVDASGNNINGTLINAPQFSMDSKEGTHALVTNGTNQYVNLGNPSALPSGTSPRTLSAWAKTNTVSGVRLIASFGSAGTGQAMFIGQSGQSLFAGGFLSNISHLNFWTTPGEWHHICLTYDGTTARLYADGVEVLSVLKNWNLVQGSAFIGKNINNSSFWDGSIDDVRIYGQALTASEVQALASAAPAIPPAPTGLNATATSSSEINLNWTDNASDEGGFEIERSITEASGYTLLQTTAANVVTFIDNGLSASTTYFYRVRAVNAAGASAYTTVVSASTSPAPGGPVAHWLLNNNAVDASGNNINGTLMNSPAFSTDSKEGSHALVTNGTNQYVDLGNPSGLPSGTSPRTMSAWAKATTTTGFHWIAAYGTNATSKAMFIGQNGVNLQAGGYGSGSDLIVNNFWTPGVWHHICLTYDGSTAILYADGAQVASGQKVWNLALLRAYIGRQVNNNEYWNGSIDDVRIYNRALSASEVQSIVGVPPSGIPIAPTNLAASPAGSSKVNLTWTDNSSNETGFQIERSLQQASGYTLIQTTAPAIVTFTDQGLTPNTEYFYRVRAVNGSLLSSYSAVASATPSQVNRLTIKSAGTIFYWEYLPPGYESNPGDKFPVVFFLHGAGQKGNTAAAIEELLVKEENTPIWHVGKGFDFPFILIAPQLKTNFGSWPVDYIDGVVEAVLANPRIDRRHVYMTGLSLGGGGVWAYASDLVTGKKLRGIAPVSATLSNTDKACNIVENNLRVWAFHGEIDPTVATNKTISMVNAINACDPPPYPRALPTIYPNVKHNAWDFAYRTNHTLHDPNLYEWMMMEVTGSTQNIAPSANAGGDKITKVSSLGFLVTGSAVDSDGTIVSYLWTKVAGGAVTLNDETTNKLHITGYANGTYTFRLTVTDDGGRNASDDMTVVVTTPPTVSAGPYKNVVLPVNSVVLNGSASDADGTIEVYKWVQRTGPSATLSNELTADLTASNLVAGTYLFRLTVLDNAGASSFDEVNVMVTSSAPAGAEATELSALANDLEGSDVIIFNNLGTKVFEGKWSDEVYTTTIKGNELYFINILREGEQTTAIKIYKMK